MEWYVTIHLPYRAFDIACESKLKEDEASFSASAAARVRTYVSYRVCSN